MPDTVLPVRETLAPHELLDRLVTDVEEELEHRHHPAAGAARRLVDLYLRARFGTHPLDERAQRTLTEVSGNAPSHLRPA